MSQLKDVYDEWQNNPVFRARFTKDPEKALKEAGLKLSPDDLKKIKMTLNRKDNKGSSDEKLGERITK
jgi:hypothetical protein